MGAKNETNLLDASVGLDLDLNSLKQGSKRGVGWGGVAVERSGNEVLEDLSQVSPNDRCDVRTNQPDLGIRSLVWILLDARLKS